MHSVLQKMGRLAAAEDHLYRSIKLTQFKPTLF